MTDDAVDVSVIMPAWNAAATIARALRSVAVQDALPAEIIVIDDGSTDDTAAIADSFADTFLPGALRVLRLPHRGAGAARNAGLAVATRRYVAFLDADDEWVHTKISRSLFYLKMEDLILVSHNYTLVRGEMETLAECDRHFNRAGDPFVSLFRRNFIATSTVVALRQVLGDAGGFDPGLPAAQDYDLWLRVLSAQEARFRVFPETLTRYYASPGGISGDVDRRRRCSLAVLYRHAPALRSRTAWPFASSWMRSLVIHYEAVMGHVAKREWINAMAAIAKAVPNMIATSWAARGVALRIEVGSLS